LALSLRGHRWAWQRLRVTLVLRLDARDLTTRGVIRSANSLPSCSA